MPVYMKNKKKKKNMFLYKIHTEPFSYFYGHYNCTETERLGACHSGEGSGAPDRTVRQGQALYRRGRAGDVQ